MLQSLNSQQQLDDDHLENDSPDEVDSPPPPNPQSSRRVLIRWPRFGLMEWEYKSHFNEMEKRMEQWMQRIEDIIKGLVPIPIHVLQNNHQEGDSRRKEIMRLDKPTISQTQPKESLTEVRIIGPSFMKQEECTDKVKVKMEELEWKAKLQEMRGEIRW